jgi:hypothetical protein
MKIGYKLFRLRKDGTIGPLFVDKELVIPVGEWIDARNDITPKTLAYRPGWHVLLKPEAPHLKLDLKNGEKRQWWQVEFDDYEIINRPECQGGQWALAKKIKVVKCFEA